MKIGNFDFFKLLLVIFIGIFLYLYHESLGNGRFQINTGFILDTKTGQTYYIGSGGVSDFTPPLLK